MASLFEEMGGTYTLDADSIYYPNLELPEEETLRYGKYSSMSRTYLREHHEGLYTGLLLSGKLNAQLKGCPRHNGTDGSTDGCSTGHHSGSQGQESKGLGWDDE